MRDIKIIESTSKAYDYTLKVGNRSNGTLGAMALGFTNKEIYKIFKEAQKAVATIDPDASIDLGEEFNEAIEELNELRDKLEAIREGLPNLSALGISIRDAEYILKVLKVVKHEVETLEKGTATVQPSLLKEQTK